MRPLGSAQLTPSSFRSLPCSDLKVSLRPEPRRCGKFCDVHEGMGGGGGLPRRIVLCPVGMLGRRCLFALLQGGVVWLRLPVIRLVRKACCVVVDGLQIFVRV